MSPVLLLMLVDDDADDQLIFVEALQSVGMTFKVLSAKDGISALRLVEEPGFEVPDAIFFDLNMPLMNGKELLGAFRAMDKFDPVPIIVFSTSSNPQDIEQCTKLGANAYLTKHGSFDQLSKDLLDVLAEHLDNFQNIPFTSRM